MRSIKSPVLTLINDSINDGKTAVLATVISTDLEVPVFLGKKLAVDSEGRSAGSLGDENLDSEVLKMCLESMKKGESTSIHFTINPDASGQTGTDQKSQVELFFDLIEAPPRMIIFGAGHIALPLTRIGKTVGFRIVVVDDREEFASRDRFPEADDVKVMDFDKSADLLNIDSTTYLVLITRGHKHDEIILRSKTCEKAVYIGMIGSKRRSSSVLASLKRDGYSQKFIDRIHTPIGVNIGSQTPEEIALSIAAEVVKVRRSL
ncbi:XdhC family protein [Acidobacteriota bacterium]